MIYIPQSISFITFDARKLLEIRPTFDFLLQLLPLHAENALTVKDLEASATNWQSTHPEPLNLNRAQELHYWQEKDGLIDLSQIKTYMVLFENLDIFRFLIRLYDTIHHDGDNNRLYIKKEVLQNILLRHRQCFSDAPDLQWLIGQKIVEERQEIYVIDRLLKHFSQPLVNRIAAILWMKLLHSPDFTLGSERLRFWYLRVIHDESWCDFTGLLDQHSLREFIQAAETAIDSETDLSSGKEEYIKMVLDTQKGYPQLIDESTLLKNAREFPGDDDLFLVYKNLLKFDYSTQSNFLVLQSSRISITFFVTQVICHEPSPKPPPMDFLRIQRLLETNSNRPYLIWLICDAIIDHRPGIIPFLASRRNMCSLGFILVWHLPQNKYLERDGRQEHLKLCYTYLELALSHLALKMPGEGETHERLKALRLFQCLLLPTLDKFKLPSGRYTTHGLRPMDLQPPAIEKMRQLVESIPIAYTVGPSSRNDLPKLFATLLSPLFDVICAYVETDLIPYGSLGLPLYKIDCLVWFLKLAAGSHEANSGIIHSAAERLNEIYLSVINCTQLDIKDPETGLSKLQLPTWFSRQDGLPLIDWGHAAVALFKENLLDNFLSPANLIGRPADDRWDKFNRFTGEKIRAHLAILLIMYNDLFSQVPKMQIYGLPIHTLLSVVENKITSLVTWYCRHDKFRNRFDIFDNHFEGVQFAGLQKELLPAIAQTINKFTDENKASIVGELIETDNLIRSFKLLDYIVTENLRDKLFRAVKTETLADQFSEMTWPEQEFVLWKIAENEIFIDKIKEVLNRFEQSVTKRAGIWQKYAVSAFRIKLTIAYNESNFGAINTTPKPDIDFFHGEKFNDYKERAFYLALLWLKTGNPKKAYDLFNEWINRSEKLNAPWVLNRFAAANSLAGQQQEESEKKRLFFQAYLEWTALEPGLQSSSGLENLKEAIARNKLVAMDGCQMDDEFDELYTDLEKSLQLHKEFLRIRINNLMRRDMSVQAHSLLTAAQQYHVLSNGKLPPFMDELRELVYVGKTIDYLQNQYNLLFQSPPEALAKIIPTAINKYTDLPHFILQEILQAAADLLTYINSIAEVKYEDKYSDLLILALSNRFVNYGWMIGPARGGFPASKKPRLGLIDFAIWMRSRERITTCEAMILRGEDLSNQRKHLKKLFNYDHARKFFFSIVYYMGARTKFENSWQAYINNCQRRINFHKDYPILKDGWKDLPDFSTDSIKVGRTDHLGGLQIFHIFININYLI